MQAFCQAHDLPRFIRVELPDGRTRQTSDRERKDIVIRRILAFALRGEVEGPTVYRKDVVASGPLPERLSSRTRIRYGQYEKKNPRFVETLQRLTGGAYRLGMISRLVLRDFWTEGTAPTMKQFAEEWVRATAAHTEPRPEGAYLVDLSRGDDGPGWKQVRIEKAKTALEILATLRSRK